MRQYRQSGRGEYTPVGASTAVSTPQQLISAACEEDLVAHGDSFRGAGYTKSPREAEDRYALMLGVIRDDRRAVSLLDFGCGLGHLFDHLQKHAPDRDIHYTGLDLSAKYLAVAKRRHPAAEFIQMDVLESDAGLPDYDYAVLNGLFNYRGGIDYQTMLEYWRNLMTVVYRHCRIGLAFNVMSRIVDWERDDLFHLPFDTMAEFVGRNLSRHFVIRHDYQAYEYTTYVYRQPIGQ
jgi:SAM-dependent methyltransferase